MPAKTAKTTKVSSAALERERWISLINSMADGVIATDEMGRIVLYNGAALNVLDVNVNLDGAYIDDVAIVLDRTGKQTNLTHLITETKTQQSNRDLRLQYPDGSISNIYLSIAPVKLGYGKEGNKGFVVVMRDITKEKSLEEERDEFISVISHELRTPIAIAEGNISNAQFASEKGVDTAVIDKTLQNAHDQIIFLSNLINDLATLSRAERGKLDLSIEKINAYDLLHELEKEYCGQAKAKSLDFRIDPADDLEMLVSSKLYVYEILQNFITNALKYTEAGSITVVARPHKSGIAFEVSDTGIGISKGDQDKVFEKFFRSENYQTRAHNGTGLGLYVTAKLVRLIHAEVSLDSKLGTGTTFTVYVPNFK